MSERGGHDYHLDAKLDIRQFIEYGGLRYLPEMQNFFGEVCETQEEWIWRRYTEIALEKKKSGERVCL